MVSLSYESVVCEEKTNCGRSVTMKTRRRVENIGSFEDHSRVHHDNQTVAFTTVINAVIPPRASIYIGMVLHHESRRRL
jgi:hypothetical protein